MQKSISVKTAQAAHSMQVTASNSDTAAGNIDWDDPSARCALIEKVGIDEYNRLVTKHIKDSIIEVVNGRSIRPINTRFGRLFAVSEPHSGASTQAFSTLERARAYANNPI